MRSAIMLISCLISATLAWAGSAEAQTADEISLVQAVIKGAGYSRMNIDGVAGPKTREGAAWLIGRHQIPHSAAADPVLTVLNLVQNAEAPLGRWFGQARCEQGPVSIDLLSFNLGRSDRGLVRLQPTTGRASLLFIDVSLDGEGGMRMSKMREIRPRRPSTAFQANGRIEGGTRFLADGNGVSRMGCTSMSLARAGAPSAPTPQASEATAPPVATLSSRDGNTPTVAHATSVLNLSGVWTFAQVRLERRSLQTSLVRNISGSIEIVDDGGSNVRVFGLGRDLARMDSIEFKAERKADEVRINPRSNQRPGGLPIRGARSHQSAHGVDILRTSDGYHLFRFRSNDDTQVLDREGLSPGQFCQGPVSDLAENALREITAAEALRQDAPLLFDSGDFRNAGIGAMFGPAFQEAFGVPIGSVSEGAVLSLIERIRVCYLFNGDKNFGRAVEQVFLRKVPKIADFHRELDIKSAARRGSEISFRATPAAIKSIASSYATSAARFAEQIANPDNTDLATRAKLLQIYANSVFPEALRPTALKAQEELAAVALAEANAAEATRPALSQTELVRNATQVYLSENCGRGLMAQIQAQLGTSGFSAGRHTGSRAGCTINQGTHLLTISVGRISNLRCSGGGERSCTFQMRWGCNYRLNPDFGFSRDLADVDPICPFIRAKTVGLSGIYAPQSHREWRTLEITFKR